MNFGHLNAHLKAKIALSESPEHLRYGSSIVQVRIPNQGDLFCEAEVGRADRSNPTGHGRRTVAVQQADLDRLQPSDPQLHVLCYRYSKNPQNRRLKIPPGWSTRGPRKSQMLYLPSLAANPQYIAQRLRPSQVAKQHGHKLIPAGETAGMALRPVLGHSPLKLGCRPCRQTLGELKPP